ncbi:isochorismate synthase [Spinactinospora alkalitolerans]|uniref:isochorismate synthase n=1 Tax=Spinactinospora alkalitolerans TaxID=687207 RepID=A0A852TVI4_9ACTN|nr:isochorismate synthase [Spinactinospora alkalitolerans]NYE46833.1 isochorismate synthase [Spinactinospora alkalitolerans]
MPLQRVAPAATAAGDLLDAYRPGASFFASASGAVLGRGALATADRLDDVAAVLRGIDGPRPIAIGAVPFDADAPAHLVVPETVHRAPSPAAAPAGGPRRRLPGTWDVRPVPEPAAHVRGVERALKLLADADGALRKVVLARCLRITGSEPVDLARVLRNLAWRDPAGFTFAMNLPPRGEEPRTLIGASPELLVAKRGRTVTSNPLAGSVPRSADPTKDQQRAVALLTSAKDRYEHAVVVEAVAEGLRPFCRRLDVPAEPEPAATATMWHLSTRITGELRTPAPPVPVLAAALHPTPAVCGTPTARARAAIGEIEPFDRGFYTGAVGYADADGDGEWVVTIRCADVAGRTLDLFAGGGIVPESDPDAELAETSAKLRTLLLALGVNQPL